MTILVVSVADGNADAEEFDDGTGFDVADDEISIVASDTDSIRKNAGFHFTGINIPSGSIIRAASLDVDVVVEADDEPFFDIHANDVDNAANFSDEADVTGRVLTSASVLWENEIGLGISTTPDFSAVIQEIIDRPGWIKNNSIVVLLMGAGGIGNPALTIAAFEHSTGAPVQLTIDFVDPPSDGPISVMNDLGVIKMPDEVVSY